MAIWRAGHDIALRTISTPSLLVVLGAKLLERFTRAQQRHAAARQNAFLDGRAGRVHGAVHASLRSFTSMLNA
jgi:hypothetical protein